MQQMSEKNQIILETAKQYVQKSNTHPSVIQWRQECLINNGFYDGTGQWREDHIEILRERGQLPIVCNIIQSHINSLSGVEIQSRFRIACKSHSERPEDEKLAKAITHMQYYIQQNQKMSHKGSLKYRDMTICGIGWSNIYKDKGKFYYEYVTPFNVIPDPDDLSPQYNEMKYVCRKRWMSPDAVKKLWPKVAKDIYVSDDQLNYDFYSPELMDRNSSYTGIGDDTGYSQSRMLVWEVQYKQPKKCYAGVDYQGNYFETFDIKKAEELTQSEDDFEETDSYRIMRTLFFGNTLLEHAPLKPAIPNLQDFSYIPCVWQRRFRTGVPYGLVELMKDTQIQLNVALVRGMYLANSTRLVVSGSMGNVQPESLREELKKADSVIVFPADVKYDLQNNSQLSREQFDIVEASMRNLQKITGIHDDLMGQETNASSGVAQKQRQISSVRNNVFSFDNFSEMKEREGQFILNLLQGDDDENIFAQILTEEEKDSIILNLVRTVKGKKVIFNDIRTFPMSIYIEEVPDFNSSSEESKANLEKVLENPNAMLILQSKELLKRLGFRDYEGMAQDMQQLNQQQQQQEMALKGGGPQQAPQDPNLVQSAMGA